MKNLTEEQIHALPEEFNLSDGHAYRPLDADEDKILHSLYDIFISTDRKQQAFIEKKYVDTFLRAAQQSYEAGEFAHYMCFTASSALEVVANYLRLEKMSVALIEPCFDNLYDILRRHGVPLLAFPDTWMQATLDKFEVYLENLDVDVIFLVSPNNPTGIELPQENLAALINYCRERNILLVLDTTFRFFQKPDSVYDAYAMLGRSDIDCIIIEDTGKTWPTKEIKAPFFSVSRRLAPQIAHIYSDFILHVSPVAIEMLRKFVALGTRQVHTVIAKNRRELHKAIDGSCLKVRSIGRMSVEWLEIEGQMDSIQLQKLIAAKGISVLTGVQFFWNHPHEGQRFLRVALQRDTEMFSKACDRLNSLLSNLQA